MKTKRVSDSSTRSRIENLHEGVRPLNRPRLNSKSTMSIQKCIARNVQSGLREYRIEFVGNIAEWCPDWWSFSQLHTGFDDICETLKVLKGTWTDCVPKG